MKKFFLFGIVLLFFCSLSFGQVAINSDGSSPHPSAGLDVNFVNKGFLLPRMTFEQVTAIQNPADGLLIFCTNCNAEGAGALTIFQGGSWKVFDINCTKPPIPLAGVHNASLNQIIWNWGDIPIAVGFKWNTVDDFATATDLGLVNTYTETGLDCWTPYTRYLWAYNSCGQSLPLLLHDTTSFEPFSPAPSFISANPTDTSLMWFWSTVPGAVGYKWNSVNDYSTAFDVSYLNFYWESGLTCLTNYTRYVWAYDDCGNSTPAPMNASTGANPPAAPPEGSHTADVTQIDWKWNIVAGADGYRWNTVDNYATATDLGTQTNNLETGLTCNTSYARYVWAYSECGVSAVRNLTKSTLLNPPAAPVTASHDATPVQIVWKWKTVAGATGYKWNTTNNLGTAIDRGTDTTATETGLVCNTNYTRYVWAYSDCGTSGSTTLSKATSLNPPAYPSPATHLTTPDQIEWNWHPVAVADGYKINSVDNYGTATEMGTDTNYLEAGLICNTSYTRYIWSYNECGVSGSGVLNQSTSLNPPPSPVASTHIPTATQVIWNWNPVNGATGYKFNTTNNLGTAQDLGNVTSKTETGLVCNTSFTRYVWAYSNCGTSGATSLNQATSLDPPVPPTAGSHFPSLTQIVWNWNTVPGATGYKWSTTNNYATAEDLSTLTTKTETGLVCNTSYTRYVWAYSNCGVSTTASLNQATTTDPPASPLAATHVATPVQITWKWHLVPVADGYKWNTTNNYASAIDLATDTSRIETGLTCNSAYTRYIWSYNECGVSSLTTLTQSTALDPPASPTAGTHVPTPFQITWNWNTVSGAIGYKWNTVNDYGTAQDMGATTTKVQTGLTCNTSYTTYIWAYSNCGVSTQSSLTQSTSLNPPAAPVTGTHTPSPQQIVWNWNTVTGATGYKWNTSNNYGTAEDMGTLLTKTETGLTCNTAYNRYVWAYSNCGVSAMTTLTQLTSLDPPAAPVAATHVPAPQQIIWKWNTVANATGYKWNTVDNIATATDLFNVLETTETGLICNTAYTRYVWAYSSCGTSTTTTLTQTTSLDPPAAPVAGTHVPTGSMVTWNWNTVAGANGYKWNTTDNYATAIEMGTSTSWNEGGLSCNTSYTRYVWAYGDCGVSTSAALTQLTTTDPPAAPAVATHVPAPTQVLWKWTTVPGATGYKWSATNNYAGATDVTTDTSYSETGLTCNTGYTRYVWAYNACNGSTATILTQVTSLDPPAAPTAGTHVPALTQIEWNWNTVAGATGYKWNTTDNLGTAQEMNAATTHTETGLTCNTAYTRYVWAYSNCGTSVSGVLTQSTSLDPPAAPGEGTHTASGSSITWNWNTVGGATGYKWNTTNNYATATDMGTNTSSVENGLACNTAYNRYVWAYSNCGVSTATTLSQMTSNEAPVAPVAGTHTATSSQIIWNWNTVGGAAGYKWSATDNFATAQDMGTSLSKTETGLVCNTAYTRYIWAYNSCGNSISTTISQTTGITTPSAPTVGTHTPDLTQITWDWNTVTDATGYKWNTVNNYSTATDVGTATSHTETGLTCGTGYTRYAWAYNGCGQSTALTMTQSTVACWVCGNAISINHVAGNVAPVNKSTSYGTVTNVPGETTKCWITKNLGATIQAATKSDTSELAAGWYWQFNRMQGYKVAGSVRTPNTTWIADIDESTAWGLSSDPCNLEMGDGWRLPTGTEWTNVDASGGWTNYTGSFNSVLKVHAAGRLYNVTGALGYRGSQGFYWSTAMAGTNYGQALFTASSSCTMNMYFKSMGFTVRCIKD